MPTTTHPSPPSKRSKHQRDDGFIQWKSFIQASPRGSALEAVMTFLNPPILTGDEALLDYDAEDMDDFHDDFHFCPERSSLILALGLPHASSLLRPLLKSLRVKFFRKTADNNDLESFAKACPQARIVYLVGSQVTNVGLRTLGKHLTELDGLGLLHLGQDVTDWGIRALARQSPKLSELNCLECVGLKGGFVSTIAKHCPGLGFIRMACREKRAEFQANVSERILASLPKGCPHLRRVAVDHRVTDDVFIDALATHCPLLEHIEVVTNSGFTDSGFDKLVRRCPHLRTIRIQNCAVAAEMKTVDASGAALGKLEIIDLKDCENITDDSLRGIGGRAPRLRGLTLGVGQVTYDYEGNEVPVEQLWSDDGFTALIKGCRQLRDVRLTHVTLSERGFMSLSSCSRLNVLLLFNCVGLSDAAVVAIAQGCSQLKEIDITPAKLLTDATAQALAQSCPSLTLINLTGAELLTDAAVAAIAQGCPELEILELFGCEKVTATGLLPLAEGCKQLESLGIAVVTRKGAALVCYTLFAKCEFLEHIVCMPDGSSDDEYFDPDLDKILTTRSKGFDGLHPLLRLGEDEDDEEAEGSRGQQISALRNDTGFAMDDSVLTAVAQRHPEIKAVAFDESFCGADEIDVVTAAGIGMLAKHCTLERVTFGSKSSAKYLMHLQTTTIPELAACSPSLEYIDMSDMPGGDENLGALAKFCHNLHTLKFEESVPTYRYVNGEPVNDLTDAGIIDLARSCPKLEHVEICKCSSLTDASLVVLAEACPLLRYVDLTACDNILDAGVVALGKHCPRLRTACLHSVKKLTDVGLAALASGCTKLQVLGLSGCLHISDAGLESVGKHCKLLRSLNMEQFGPHVTLEGVISIVRGCPFLDEKTFKCGVEANVSRWGSAQESANQDLVVLTDVERRQRQPIMATIFALFRKRRRANVAYELDLERFRTSPQMNDVAAVLIAKQSPALVTFRGHCGRPRGSVGEPRRRIQTFSDAGVKALAAECTQLERFELNWSDRVSDSGIKALAKQCTGLKEVVLRGSLRITNASVVELSRRCSALVTLDLGMCARISDKGAAQLAHCPRLQHLSLASTKISDKTLLAVSKACPLLKKVNISDCALVTDVGIEALEGLGHLAALYCGGDCRLLAVGREATSIVV